MKIRKKLRGLENRFRGLLPVVVDVETGGLDPKTHALLEVAFVLLAMDDAGKLHLKETISYHIKPFRNAVLDESALEINKIDPYRALRFAIPEKQAIYRIFSTLQKELAKTACYRAVLVGHNAWFDLSFILAAARRSKIRPIPFHAFTTFDTATLICLATLPCILLLKIIVLISFMSYYSMALILRPLLVNVIMLASLLFMLP